MEIRNYTLNFVRLGKPLNNQYPIYLRYFYTLNQKKCSYNYNCNTQLTIEQLNQLKTNQLTSSIQLPLLQEKERLEQIITALYIQYDQYPEAETLKECLTVRAKKFTIKSLIEEFIKSHKYKAKEISLKKYRESLKHLETYINYNPKYFNTYNDLVTERTIKSLENYLDGLVSIGLKKISNNTFKNTISMTVRFLNYVAKKYNLTPLEYKVKIPLLSEKVHITQSEFNNMITYNVNDSGLRKDHRANLKLTQDLVYTNSYVGLRINEFLKLKKSNLTFNDDHISIRFYEQKKNDIREIIIIDKKAIDIIRQYSNQSKTEFVFNLYVNVFNNSLKTLARLTGMTEPVDYIKNYRTKIVTLTEPKWKLISSHAIRRYAVNQNVVRYGIDVARQFSGHKDYSTIKKRRELLDEMVQFEVSYAAAVQQGIDKDFLKRANLLPIVDDISVYWIERQDKLRVEPDHLGLWSGNDD